MSVLSWTIVITGLFVCALGLLLLQVIRPLADRLHRHLIDTGKVDAPRGRGQ